MPFGDREMVHSAAVLRRDGTLDWPAFSLTKRFGWCLLPPGPGVALLTCFVVVSDSSPLCHVANLMYRTTDVGHILCVMCVLRCGAHAKSSRTSMYCGLWIVDMWIVIPDPTRRQSLVDHPEPRWPGVFIVFTFCSRFIAECRDLTRRLAGMALSENMVFRCTRPGRELCLALLASWCWKNHRRYSANGYN